MFILKLAEMCIVAMGPTFQTPHAERRLKRAIQTYSNFHCLNFNVVSIVVNIVRYAIRTSRIVRYISYRV